MSVNFDCTLYHDKGSSFKTVSALDVQRYAPSTRAQKPIRAVDIASGEIIWANTIDASKHPAERLLHLETDTGYILECTPDTMIYTGDGYKPAELLELNEKIVVNGSPCEKYKEKEWLEEWYVKRGKTQAEIAEMCSTIDNHVSERTIRAWVKRFGLGRGDSGAVFGEKNPRYKGDDLTSHKGLYERARFLKEKPDNCEVCGRKTSEIDYHHLDHNLYNASEDNIVAICPKCHAMFHHGATVKHTRPAFITVKIPAGSDPTISIECEGDNFVASGFIVKSEKQ